MGIFHKNRRLKKSRSDKPKLHQIEMLEDRRLMAGLVMNESMFELAQFRDNIHEQMFSSGGTMQVTGYAFEITQREDGSVVYFDQFNGAGGNARLEDDPNNGDPSVAISEVKRQEIASVSKPITAVGILKNLQDQAVQNLLQANGGEFTGDMLTTELNTQLDTTLGNYLPDNWTLGPGVAGITIRELLTHTSGISTYAKSESELIPVLAAGLQDADTDGNWDKNYDYSTTNFTTLRVMLPYLWNAVDNGILNDINDGTVDWAEAETSLGTIDGGAALQALEDEFGSLETLTHEQISVGLYKHYLRTRVLEPAGIIVADAKPADPATETLLYTYPDNLQNGAAPGDQTLNLGGRGWNLSAHDLQLFVSHVRFNSTLLTSPTRELMDEGLLGWHGTPGTSGSVVGDFGAYLNHQGNNFRTSAGTGGTRANALAMQFPNNVQVGYVNNSQTGPAFGSAFDPSGTANNTRNSIAAAYDNAWTHLVYEGFDNQDDVITIQINGSDSDFLDIVTPTGTITRRIDTLQSLTINGLGGDDQFFVDQLPSSIELVLNGGTGDDTWFAASSSGNLELVNGITFNGGAGIDSVELNDDSNPYSHPDSNSYFVGADQVHRLGGTQGNVISVDLFLNNVEHNTLTTSSQGDWVEVLNTGWTTMLNLGNGNDTVGGASDFENIEAINGLVINGGSGIDTVSLSDENNPYSHPLSNQYSISSESVSRFMDSRALPGKPVQVKVEMDSVETLNLTTGEQGDVVLIENMPLTGGTIDTGAGDDVVMTTSGNLEDVDGLVIESGKGEDQVLLDDGDNPYVHPFGNVYQVTSEDVFRPSNGQSDGVSGVNVYFYDNEHLRLDSGNKGDIVSVHSVAWSTTLNTGGGDDAVLASPNSRDMERISGLVVNGGAGQDYVSIDDDNNPYTHVMSNQYSASAERVSRYGTIGLSGPQHSDPEDNPMLAIEVFVDMDSVETLDLVTGDESDVVRVSSTTSLGTTIETGNGHDRVTTLSEMAEVDGLVLDLGYGEDTLLVTDSANPYSDPTDNQYELDSSSVLRGLTSPARIDYSNLEHLQVVTGEQADRVKLLGGGELSTQVLTSGGDDTIHASPVSENLEDVAGLVVDGGAGEDELLLHDRANPYSHAFSRNYVVTPESTSRSMANPMAPAIAVEVEVTYSQLENLRLEAGNLNDLIQVEGAAAQMGLSLYANNGSDQVVVNGPVFVEMHLEGDNPTHAPGDRLKLNVPSGSSGTHLPDPSTLGAGAATIDDAVIHYSEFEEVNTQSPNPTEQGDLAGDFDGNGIVNGDDLDNAVAGWKKRYGTNLNGSSFLQWQRNFGKKVASEANNNEIVIPVMASAEQELAKEEPADEELTESLLELPEKLQPIGGIYTVATDLYFSMLQVLSDGGEEAFEDTVMKPILTESFVKRSIKNVMPSMTEQSISSANTLDYPTDSDYEINSRLTDDSIVSAVFDEYDPLAMPRL